MSSAENNSGRKMPRERVGEISFLLTKLALERSIEELALALGISTEEMRRYVETMNTGNTTKTLFHRDECPACIIGILMIEKLDILNHRANLRCGNCQALFYHENS